MLFAFTGMLRSFPAWRGYALLAAALSLSLGLLILGRLPRISTAAIEPGMLDGPPQSGAKARPWLRLAILASIVLCALASAVGWLVVAWLGLQHLVFGWRLLGGF